MEQVGAIYWLTDICFAEGMQIHKLVLLLFLIVTTLVYAKTIAEWKSRTIYQLLTDRFARSTSSAHHTNQTKWDCDLGNYCGGTYRGIINKLDYITNMGFNAVRYYPLDNKFLTNSFIACRSGFHPLLKIPLEVSECQWFFFLASDTMRLQ